MAELGFRVLACVGFDLLPVSFVVKELEFLSGLDVNDADGNEAGNAKQDELLWSEA